MWKNIVESDKSHGACALHAEYLRLQTHTLGICNAYSFFTAKNALQCYVETCIVCHVQFPTNINSQCDGSVTSDSCGDRCWKRVQLLLG